jgi:hypothetical protein
MKNSCGRKSAKGTAKTTSPSPEMTERWEYATVIWSLSVSKKEFPVQGSEWAVRKDLHIWLPGTEQSDHRPISDSEDDSISGPRNLDVMNELGADGWELACRETTGSAVGISTYGWPEASFPVATTWHFKRPVT